MTAQDTPAAADALPLTPFTLWTPEQIDRIIDEKCAEAIARREYTAFKQQLQAVN